MTYTDVTAACTNLVIPAAQGPQGLHDPTLDCTHGVTGFDFRHGRRELDTIAAARDCLEVADAAAGAARPGPERETAGLYLAMSSAANRVARLPILSRRTTGGLRFWYALDLALIREDLLAKRHLRLAELVGRMSMARIYAGAHFRFSTGDGVTEGRSATTLVLKRVALRLD